MTNQPAPVGEQDVAGHTPLPWAYRPEEHDDWGVIRTTVTNENGWHPVVAQARYVGNPTDDDLAAHRRDKTDPAGPNAALIVRAVNNHAMLVQHLTNAVSALESWRVSPIGGLDPMRALLADIQASERNSA